MGLFREYITLLKGATARRGYLALADQMVVSGANFLTMLLLARAMIPAEYGIFVLLYSAMILAFNLQNAFVTSPLLVFAPPLEGDKLRHYATASLCQQTILGLTVSPLTILVAYLVAGNKSEVLNALPATGGAIFLFVLHEFFRKLLYARLKMKSVLLVDTLSHTFRLFLLLLFLARSTITCSNAYSMFFYGYALGVAVGFLLCFPLFSYKMGGLKEIWLRNWRYGRWLAATSVVMLARMYIPQYILTSFVGTVGPAVLGACQNLIAPLGVLWQAVGNVATPTAASRFASGGFSSLKEFVAKLQRLRIPIACSYALALTLGAGVVLNLLYKGKYDQWSHLIGLYAIGVILFTLAQDILIAFNAARLPRYSFLSFCVSAAMVLPLAYPAALIGIEGTVVLLTIIAAGTTLTVSYIVWNKKFVRKNLPRRPD